MQISIFIDPFTPLNITLKFRTMVTIVTKCESSAVSFHWCSKGCSRDLKFVGSSHPTQRSWLRPWWSVTRDWADYLTPSKMRDLYTGPCSLGSVVWTGLDGWQEVAWQIFVPEVSDVAPAHLAKSTIWRCKSCGQTRNHLTNVNTAFWCQCTRISA